MEIHTDFRELLASFNAHRVEYVVVGGYAMAFHGVPRYTGDIDVFLHPTGENARRVLEALDDFGFGDVGLAEGDFVVANQVVQLGVPPVRIDLVTGIDGVDWEAADAGKTPGAYADVPVFYIGREQLIANKRATGRPKDIADLDALDATDPD